jgi:hypothetical protein
LTDGGFADFTEDGYRRALALACATPAYSFEPFGTDTDAPHVLWRHDVDVSVHRAARIAAIEADHGARSTFFFSLHSAFYNLLEREVAGAARAALAHGHWLGLHYDSAFHGGVRADEIEREAALLADVLEHPVGAISFHNPDLGDDLAFDDEFVGGLVNAYGRRLKERYAYVSDSNGHWRFDSLFDVLAQRPPLLHVLTHPEWWQAEPMPPRARIVRSVDGRAERVLQNYDELLASAGRDNIA